MKNSYICPHCKHKQNTIVEWQTISVAYEISIRDRIYSDVMDKSDTADHETWNCPECGEDLPQKLVDKLDI